MAARTPKEFPPQHQDINPGQETAMNPPPAYDAPNYKGSGKLKDKVAIVTGGDSGIGRSVSILYAREGAKAITILYLENHKDAEDTKKLVEKEGAECLIMAGDVGKKEFCEEAVKATVDRFQKVDILVNHAGVQYVVEKLEDITSEQLEKTFRVNVFSYFYMTQAALKYMEEGSCIINTSSINAYKGNPVLIDYSSTKGANRAFTYSLAINLAPRGIRVNAVAPGPIWTPFIPGSFKPEKVAKFGQKTLLGRAGQPEEVAPAYVFLASNADSSYVTGQTIHVNGGMISDS